jgi:hypothetical protein
LVGELYGKRRGHLEDENTEVHGNVRFDFDFRCLPSFYFFRIPRLRNAFQLLYRLLNFQSSLLQIHSLRYRLALLILNYDSFRPFIQPVSRLANKLIQRMHICPALIYDSDEAVKTAFAYSIGSFHSEEVIGCVGGVFDWF